MYKIAYFLLLSCYLPVAVAKENSMEKLLKMPFEKLYNLKVAPSPKPKPKPVTKKSTKKSKQQKK